MERLGAGARLSEAEYSRYSRHLLLPEVGVQGQQRLKAARVLVVGAGGLGCPVLQYLAAAGVGTLGIADADTVEESNLQRQVLYTTADIGMRKTDAAARRLSALNPLVTIEQHPVFLTAENARELIAGYDIVVDGSDNFPTRYTVDDTCAALGTPLVFGSILGFEGQVAVFSYRGCATYRSLYPEPPDPRDAPSCAELGVLGVLPGIIGCLQAGEVLKILLGAGDILAGRLLLFNALSMQTAVFTLPRPAHTPTTDTPAPAEYCTPGAAHTPAATDGVHTMTVHTLHERLQRGDNLHLLDVRTDDERARCSLGGTHIPLDALATRLAELPRDMAIVVYCHRGGRSAQAAALLAGHGFGVIYTVEGGIDRWAGAIDSTMVRY